ncbi:MAG: glycosyltransferase family 4 protein [Sphingomonadaceae bacterium]
MRLFAALGPGNIVADQRAKLAGPDGPGETSIAFSRQFVAYAQARGFPALLISYHGTPDRLSTGDVTLENMLRSGAAATGLMYHLHHISYGIRLLRRARRFRADLALIDSGSTHYFVLSLFWLFGIKVAVNLHNVRWPQGFEPTGIVGKAIRWLDSRFFRYGAIGATGCSPACADQLRADGADHLPYFGWCGQFLEQGFSAHSPAANTGFRIMFAGRVERNKGVFDLIDIAARLRCESSVPITFEICGDGTALNELRTAVSAAGLDDHIITRGRLGRADLLDGYARCDAVIVPTRGDFCEGMPLVCAEATLSGRPVITSRLSNALPVIGAAIAEAQPEDVGSYVAVIRALAENRSEYDSLQSACHSASRLFLDRSQGYAAAIDRLICHLTPGMAPLSDYDALYVG